MPERYSNRISKKWLQAAVLGSLWASFEIIIGSFLHNLRVPFAGTMLSFASVALVIAFIQVWKSRGLIWRAGLIAAMLKSLSPSAIILGPMIGIFTEALILEIIIFLLGRNIFGYMLAGAFAVFSTLLHKVASLLVTYGFDLVVIAGQVYQYIIHQLGMMEENPLIIISAIVFVYFLAGMLAAVLGYLGGKKALSMALQPASDITPDKSATFFSENLMQKSTPWLLLYHLICIVACLYLINVLPIWYSVLPSAAYAIFCLYTYRRSMRSFRKPSFWIWFMAITILAAIFWNGLSKGELWDGEGLIAGLKMNLRAVVILTGFAALSHELRNPIIRTVLYHHGFASVYHSVGLAFSVLPGIIDDLPGLRKMAAHPVGSLGSIVRRATGIYPALQRELREQPPLVVVTGEIQQGKTTFIRALIPQLTGLGIRVNGIIANGIHDESGRIGYDLEDATTGESRAFIRKHSSPGDYRHGKYYFSHEGLAFGQGILEKIRKTNTDLAVIDEVGPVEMKGRGWAGNIEKLVNIYRIPQIWTVRKPLLKKLVRQWNVGEVLLIDVSREKPGEAAAAIAEFIRTKT